jgi:6-phosphogluconate dehydrogenase
MVPAGDATEAQIAELMEHLEPGDTIVDGGNTNFHDDQRRHGELAKQGVNYVDAGTSGGIWGLQVGYCLMVGGDAAAVTPLEPIFTSLARRAATSTSAGPGAGHYVKMVHNGIEYGLMQAYAEGFEIMHASSYDLDLGAISELWMQGSVVRSWLLELADGRSRANGPDLEHIRATSRLRRGPLDGPGGDRPRSPGTGHHAVAPDSVPVAPGRLVRREGPRRSRNEFGGHEVKTE